MSATWRDDTAYPSARNRQVEPPMALPVPSEDVARVRDLAQRFEYGDDGWVATHDDSERLLCLAVAVVGTAVGVALIAVSIRVGVGVARWLGWA